MKRRIGIDLGGTTAKLGLTNENGKILRRTVVDTGFGVSGEGLKARLLQGCLQLCPAEERQNMSSIGIGVPGTVEKTGATLTFGPNLGVHNVSFAEAFRSAFDCPVCIENDANCAALAELYQGAGQGLQDFLVVTLGTGVGGGIILDGKLYRGFNGIAGEIGHMVIRQGGRRCNCGKTGCLEAYASSLGLIQTAKEALAKYPESKLKEIEKWSALAVLQARDAGDLAAEQAFGRYVEDLACGLNNLIAVMQFEKILLGGGISGYGEKLLQPLREKVNGQLMEADCRQTEIGLAEAGNDAGIIGAAMLTE